MTFDPDQPEICVPTVKYGHSWGLWRPIADPMIIEWGNTDGFVYVRECGIYGCSAKQKVKQLEISGPSVIFDSKREK